MLTGAIPLAAVEVRAPQMASFSIPCADPAGVQRHLWQRHRIEIPGEMLYDLSLLRLSVQAYTRESDCERLVAALRTAVCRRRRL